jgi:hypothetical protein
LTTWAQITNIESAGTKLAKWTPEYKTGTVGDCLVMRMILVKKVTEKFEKMLYFLLLVFYYFFTGLAMNRHDVQSCSSSRVWVIDSK